MASYNSFLEIAIIFIVHGDSCHDEVTGQPVRFRVVLLQCIASVYACMYMTIISYNITVSAQLLSSSQLERTRSMDANILLQLTFTVIVILLLTSHIRIQSCKERIKHIFSSPTDCGNEVNSKLVSLFVFNDRGGSKLGLHLIQTASVLNSRKNSQLP